MAHFAQRLHDAIRQKQTPALVGLDPRFERIPASCIEEAKQQSHPDELSLKADAFERFCNGILDVIADLVPAVKPQAAFFEELGPAGMAVLARVIRRGRDAGLLVICDAKRGDIGSTAEAYARGFLAGENPDAAAWAADALTVNPYLGPDTLSPFVEVAEQRGAGIYVLVRTSNPESGKFQDRLNDPVPLYRDIGQTVETLSAQLAQSEAYGPIGAVVGATCPEELIELRQHMPHVPFLVPGYGSQGGTSADVAGAFDEQGFGALVNSSRGINFAHALPEFSEKYGEAHWQEAVREATLRMIADLAKHTPASRLA
ncbi:MAG: orotidine-5'-phosphate decarboxylase [Planctomycetaceae bacterium]